MHVEILRTYEEKQTVSDINVKDEEGTILFSCKGLEPPDKGNKHNISCIPEGTYKVTKEATSVGHTYPHFRVYNVKDRGGILIHSGNYYSDTLGCLLVGKVFGDKNADGISDVLFSRDTLKKLYAILPDTFQATYKKK